MLVASAICHFFFHHECEQCTCQSVRRPHEQSVSKREKEKETNRDNLGHGSH